MRAVVKLTSSVVQLGFGAGIIEGTVSQMHPPVLSYGFKLTIAAGLALLLCVYLGRAGVKS